MIRLRTVRVEQTDEGAIGAFLFDNRLFCISLEPDDGDPKRYQIPPGIYPLNHFDGNKRKNTLEITVPGHSALFFYAGNVEDHSPGCTILGAEADKLKGQRLMLNSGKTFKRFQQHVVPNINLGDEIEIINLFELYKKRKGIIGKLFKSKLRYD